MRDIQVFLDYTSFYQRFIQGLSKLAKPLISMLKMTSTQSVENSLLSMDGAEDAEIRSGISSTTRLAENSSPSGIWLNMLRLVAIVKMVMIKRLKDHFFPSSQTYL